MKNARIMIIIQAVLMYVAHIFFFTVFFIDIPKGENNSVGLLLLGIGAAVVCVAAACGFEYFEIPSGKGELNHA